jgi:hypothetical protein
MLFVRRTLHRLNEWWEEAVMKSVKELLLLLFSLCLVGVASVARVWI